MVIKSIYQNKPFPKDATTIVNNFRFLIFDTVNHSSIGKAAYGFGSASYLYVLFRNYLVMDIEDIDAEYNDKLVVSKQIGGSIIRTCYYILEHPDIQLDDLIHFSYDKKIRNLYDFSKYKSGYSLAYAVGLAIDAKLSQKESHNTRTNKIYCIVTAADLNSNYALAALKTAVNQNLDNLVIIYDNNRYEDRGANSDYLVTDFSTIVKDLGYKYINVVNGNNLDKIDVAFNKAVNAKKPAFVEINTIVGHGYKTAGTHEALNKNLDQSELDDLIKRFEYNGEEFKVLIQTTNDILPVQKERNQKLKRLINDQITMMKQSGIKLPDHLTSFVDWKIDANQIADDLSFSQLKAVMLRTQPNTILLHASDNDYYLEQEVDALNNDRVVLLGNWIELAQIIAFAITEQKVHLPIINTDIDLIYTIAIKSLLYKILHSPCLYLINTPKGFTKNFLNLVYHTLYNIEDSLVLQPGTYDELKYCISHFYRENKANNFLVLPHANDLVNANAERINLGGYELINNSYASVNIVTGGSDLIKALSFRDQLMQNSIVPRIISVISTKHFDEMDAVSKSMLLNNFPSYFMGRMEEVAWGSVLSKNPLELVSVDEIPEFTVEYKKTRRSQKNNAYKNNKIKALSGSQLNNNTQEETDTQTDFYHSTSTQEQHLLNEELDIKPIKEGDILKRSNDYQNQTNKESHKE
ncbi:thiamine pyrophosphate-dependent enzyme [Mycoplasma sp. E35C]|uniref:thiamine pyrophosphate-dependent enzyme n=1 Tax=Mycoplasma sp. E35C TaxID=2801918 RepID=UPI001CA39F9C|nr:thiamine pyrophosphate-dependent enzyme [Mycoplasma sp. E35C]QZX49007.1 transketolase [Mycoplasma sp. E35C]